MIPKNIHYCWFEHIPLKRVLSKLFILSMSACIVSFPFWQKETIIPKIARRWSEVSFFLFGFHGVIALFSCKLIASMLPEGNQLLWIFSYFLNVMIMVTAVISFYLILRKIFPKAVSVLTGNRYYPDNMTFTPPISHEILYTNSKEYNIPKTIHYCWFGHKPLPRSAKKCIESWKKFFPDWEIKEWNEDNFDVNMTSYTKEAYAGGHYAFVSDYARFKILYDHGGLYFDTDVEVIAPFDDILDRGGFMGIEAGRMINPGLGMACVSGGAVTHAILKEYQASRLALTHQGVPVYTISTYVHRALSALGFSVEGKSIEKVGEFYVYPPEFFNPLDDITGVVNKTDNTRSIHWFSKTWMKNQSPIKIKISRLLHRYIGVSLSSRLKHCLHIK